MRITASPARSRLLDTAARLFYTEGIHAVGVDRLVNEAKITRATFYRQFPAKDELVRAYLERTDRATRAKVESLAEQANEPRELINALAGWLAMRYFDHTRFKATRRQLARLGIGELAGLMP